MVIKILATILSLFLTANVCADDKSFVIVIPSYNNKDWYKRNLDSVFSQSYENFRVIYIDDASPDGTGNWVKGYIRKYGLENRVTLIQNEKRVGALANIYQAVWQCLPDEIVVNLDGDDWFAHYDVLSQLNNVYADRSVWLTHGQFIYYPKYTPGFGVEIPQEIIEKNNFRSFTEGSTALRTFYAGLFHRIKKEDLLYEGDFFQAGYDLAIMFPMLEMAGKHIKFIPEVSYVYNINTPINDHKVNFDKQADIDHYLRNKEKYTPIRHFKQSDSPKKIYITPGLWGELFSIDNPVFNRDNCLEVLYKLREYAAGEGFELMQADSVEDLKDFDFLVVFDVFLEQLPHLEKYPKEKLILFLWEPPTVLPENYNLENHECFSKVYTWNDALVDNEKYFKFYYPVFHPIIDEPVDFYLKRLCTLISCNKESSYPGELYSERRKVIDFYENYARDDFDLYGKWWPQFYKTYQGPIGKKVDYLKYYKFSYAYENIRNVPGYVTEKIFDCFQACAVPIYWGAPNIGLYVQRDCFISRGDFESESELYEYLKNMPVEEYEQYLTNIRQFLSSPSAKQYSINNFIQIFMDAITL